MEGSGKKECGRSSYSDGTTAASWLLSGVQRGGGGWRRSRGEEDVLRACQLGWGGEERSSEEATPEEGRRDGKLHCFEKGRGREGREGKCVGGLGTLLNCCAAYCPGSNSNGLGLTSHAVSVFWGAWQERLVAQGGKKGRQKL